MEVRFEVASTYSLDEWDKYDVKCMDKAGAKQTSRLIATPTEEHATRMEFSLHSPSRAYFRRSSNIKTNFHLPTY